MNQAILFTGIRGLPPKMARNWTLSRNHMLSVRISRFGWVVSGAQGYGYRSASLCQNRQPDLSRTIYGGCTGSFYSSKVWSKSCMEEYDFFRALS